MRINELNKNKRNWHDVCRLLQHNSIPIPFPWLWIVTDMFDNRCNIPTSPDVPRSQKIIAQYHVYLPSISSLPLFWVKKSPNIFFVTTFWHWLTVDVSLVAVLHFWWGTSSRWCSQQGGLRSQTLFNLYVNGLGELGSTRLDYYIDGICMNNLSNADDMILLSASICGLRKLITICEAYAGRHGLIYNEKKTV